MEEYEGEIEEEYPVYFLNCTCKHKKEQHGWGCCEVDGCNCQGGWEE